MDTDRILRVVKESLRLDDFPTLEDDQKTLKNWDSINHLYLIMNLEKEFGVKFEMSKIPDLTSIAAIERELTQ